MNKQEIQARIEKLEKQVKRAEDKGNFDSAHHKMLESYKRMLKPEPEESVSLETPVKATRRADYGKQD